MKAQKGFETHRRVHLGQEDLEIREVGVDYLALRYSWHNLQNAVSRDTPFTADVATVARILSDKRFDTCRDNSHPSVIIVVQDGLSVSTVLT
jgi:hypothetical protein